MSKLNIVLASQSPRRRELLELMQIPFTAIAADIDETFNPDLPVTRNIMDIAEKKARAVIKKLTKSTADTVILGADTTVVFGNKPLGKPSGREEAYAMLAELQGTSHKVMTGFALLQGTLCHTDYATTLVEFSPMTGKEINHYIDTQQPFDKAGAYGIQDPFMSCFIRRIEGCYYNVVGLPLSHIYSVMRTMGLV
ncbi:MULTISPECIES: Maf family protein [Prosthecochloris]|uniref:dTTP/UTP pyrophosphatase n=1 Tax=Prosthecochloris marina TaxID=2017681 RepID=A0A317TBT3_9CHLB|nr:MULTISPECIES: Maf family protein [Prosthecochloris]PWW83341.1 septum formation protein Maf [Prosthecochloris marina]UZJ36546.1 Maf family protein [Prosthecochloris sp. SCSIO W1103]